MRGPAIVPHELGHNAKCIDNGLLQIAVSSARDIVCANSGMRQTMENVWPACLKTYQYYEQFKNSSGLLESPEGWRIVDSIVGGKPSNSFSQHARLFAYSLGLWNEQEQGKLMDRIMDPKATIWTLGEPSFHYALDILEDLPEELIRFADFVRTVYEARVETGVSCLGHTHPGSTPGAFSLVRGSPGPRLGVLSDVPDLSISARSQTDETRVCGSDYNPKASAERHD